MSDHLKKNVLLLGAGQMALEYEKVLKALEVPLEVVGRDDQSASHFESVTGRRVFRGGLSQWLKTNKSRDYWVINAVSYEELSNSANQLLNSGFRQILLEKPAGLTSEAIDGISALSSETKARVLVAYNRRFYTSLLEAQKLIEEDGGVLSFNFEFTEWPHVVTDVIKNPIVLENWFLANSSHVVDMAFFLGGYPEKLSTVVSGALPWHSKASVFAGAGKAHSGALFSYQANWSSAGRWSVEMLTSKRRFIFRPLEKLQIQKIGTVQVEEYSLSSELDSKFKPGVYLQTRFFLEGGQHPNFVTIQEHAKRVREIYKPILLGNT